MKKYFYKRLKRGFVCVLCFVFASCPMGELEKQIEENFSKFEANLPQGEIEEKAVLYPFFFNEEIDSNLVVTYTSSDISYLKFIYDDTNTLIDFDFSRPVGGNISVSITIIISTGEVQESRDYTLVIKGLPEDLEQIPRPTIEYLGSDFLYGSTRLTIATTLGGCEIYYTLDGKDPTKKSTLYSGSFTITTQGSVVVKAIAYNVDYLESKIAARNLDVQFQAGDSPSITVPSGDFNYNDSLVTIAVVSNPVAVIHYTLDGSDPTVSANNPILYTAPFAILEEGAVTVKAVVVAVGYNNPIVEMVLTVVVVNPTGFIASSGTEEMFATNPVARVVTYRIEPANGAYKSIEWVSDNMDVATLTHDADATEIEITAVSGASGSVVLTGTLVKIDDTTLTATVNVRVFENETSAEEIVAIGGAAVNVVATKSASVISQYSVVPSGGEVEYSIKGSGKLSSVNSFGVFTGSSTPETGYIVVTSKANPSVYIEIPYTVTGKTFVDVSGIGMAALLIEKNFVGLDLTQYENIPGCSISGSGATQKMTIRTGGEVSLPGLGKIYPSTVNLVEDATAVDLSLDSKGFNILMAIDTANDTKQIKFDFNIFPAGETMSLNSAVIIEWEIADHLAQYDGSGDASKPDVYFGLSSNDPVLFNYAPAGKELSKSEFSAWFMYVGWGTIARTRVGLNSTPDQAVDSGSTISSEVPNHQKEHAWAIIDSDRFGSGDTTPGARPNINFESKLIRSIIMRKSDDITVKFATANDVASFVDTWTTFKANGASSSFTRGSATGGEYNGTSSAYKTANVETLFTLFDSLNVLVVRAQGSSSGKRVNVIIRSVKTYELQ